MGATSEQTPGAAARHAWEDSPHAATFGHLLVCLDGSASAEGVLPLAAHLARLEGAGVTLLRVLDAPAGPAEVRATDAIACEIARERAKSYVNRIAAELGKEGIAAEGRVAEGSAAHEIKSLAGHLRADLTVLATHGEGSDRAWTLGGTAQKVLEVAEGAVLLVPGHPRCSKPASAILRRIFVPLDGSLRSECALPTALRLARADGAEIVVAHVASNPTRSEVLYTESDFALASDLADRLALRADAYVDQIRARIHASGAESRKAVTRATDHRAGLVALATSLDADLVVLTAHGSVCDTHRRFGSVTAYFIAYSSAPVLVLQDLSEKGRSPRPSSSRPPPRSVDAVERG